MGMVAAAERTKVLSIGFLQKNLFFIDDNTIQPHSPVAYITSPTSSSKWCIIIITTWTYISTLSTLIPQAVVASSSTVWIRKLKRNSCRAAKLLWGIYEDFLIPIEGSASSNRSFNVSIKFLILNRKLFLWIKMFLIFNYGNWSETLIKDSLAVKLLILVIQVVYLGSEWFYCILFI